MSDIKQLVIEYVESVHALHTIHSSTDVHERGLVAGQAITPHCAVTCQALGGYHDETLLRFKNAETALLRSEALANTSVGIRGTGAIAPNE
jgi:hypothetical protein